MCRRFLLDGESIVGAYKTVRDQAVFTSHRIFIVDMQGVTGTRQEIFVLPYRKIVHFGIQTAGFGDPLQTSELTVCYADEHEMKFGFIGQEGAAGCGAGHQPVHPVNKKCNKTGQPALRCARAGLSRFAVMMNNEEWMMAFSAGAASLEHIAQEAGDISGVAHADAEALLGASMVWKMAEASLSFLRSQVEPLSRWRMTLPRLAATCFMKRFLSKYSMRSIINTSVFGKVCLLQKPCGSGVRAASRPGAVGQCAKEPCVSGLYLPRFSAILSLSAPMK